MFKTYFTLVLATVSVLIYIFLDLKAGKKYDEIIKTIDGNVFRLSKLYFIGFAALDILHFSVKSKKARKRIAEIAELSGKKYAEYYYYVSKGAEFTFAVLGLTVFSVLAAFSQNFILSILSIVMAGCGFAYVEEQIANRLSDRKEELMLQFPEVLSKLTLLISSGMTLREAWKKVSGSGDGILYKEMQVTTDEFQTGVTEIDAYQNFAQRCGIKEIRKFAATIVQNLQKGNAELAFFLRDMTTEIWEEKQNIIKRKGEAANSKLMIPMFIIFGGILALIMVPMLTSFNL